MQLNLDPVVAALRADPRVLAVFLFGSHARGEARTDSDVDVGVVLDPAWYEPQPRADQAAAVFEIRRIAERAAPSIDLDVVVLNAAHPLAAWDAVHAGRRLWSRDDGALADFALWVLGRYEDWQHLNAIEMQEVRRRLALPSPA